MVVASSTILFLFKICSQLLKGTSTRVTCFQGNPQPMPDHSRVMKVQFLHASIVTSSEGPSKSQKLLWFSAKAFVVTVSQLSIFCHILFISFPQELIFELVMNFLHANLYFRSTSWNLTCGISAFTFIFILM